MNKRIPRVTTLGVDVLFYNSPVLQTSNVLNELLETDFNLSSTSDSITLQIR